MDLTPLVPEGRQQVESYGDGGFRVSGVRFSGSILIFPQRSELWSVTDFAALDRASLQPVLDQDPPIELLLIGCGPRLQLVPKALRQELRAAGLAVEPMDTGAACRTYNILMAEGRAVAAGLILN